MLQAANTVPADPVGDLYPTQLPELAREMVTVSHIDLKRVQELVGARPSLSQPWIKQSDRDIWRPNTSTALIE